MNNREWNDRREWNLRIVTETLLSSPKGANRRSDSQVFMVENCGMENERIFTRAEDIPEDASYYSLIIVKDPKK